jgi:hypothetical protein
MAYEATGTDPAGRGEPPPRRDVGKGWYWLLLPAIVVPLIVPLYNHDHPRLIGIPFFYWFQMALILLSVLLTYIVYRRTRGER